MTHLVRSLEPDVVGLSVMTFQRKTALEIIRLVRALRPAARIVVGGYDASLAPDPYEAPSAGVDFIVRGEGDLTFRDLLRALEQGAGFDGIAGLSYRAPTHGSFVRNPARPVSDLDDGTVRPPNRAARVLTGYTMLGRQVDMAFISTPLMLAQIQAGKVKPIAVGGQKRMAVLPDVPSAASISLLVISPPPSPT